MWEAEELSRKRLELRSMRAEARQLRDEIELHRSIATEARGRISVAMEHLGVARSAAALVTGETSVALRIFIAAAMEVLADDERGVLLERAAVRTRPGAREGVRLGPERHAGRALGVAKARRDDGPRAADSGDRRAVGCSEHPAAVPQ